MNQYFHNLAEIFPERLLELLRKDFHYYYTKGFRNFSKIFCLWFGQRAQTFYEIFWRVWRNIFWNIGRNLLVKILETSDTKSCRNFYAKFLEVFRSRSHNFLTNISTTLQKYFPKNYRKSCSYIPTIITRKVSETFPKYLVYGLEENTNILRNVLAILEQHLL